MSDKSVKKTLDWPNWKEHQTLPVQGHYTEEVQDQSQNPSQQLNPTENQNMTPLGQNQFMPTATIGYGGKGEGSVVCGRHNKSWFSHTQAELEEDMAEGKVSAEEGTEITPEVEADLSIDVDCPSCGKQSFLGPLGSENVFKAGKWVCPFCNYIEVIESEEDLEDLLFNVFDDEEDFTLDEQDSLECPICEQTFKEDELDHHLSFAHSLGKSEVSIRNVDPAWCEKHNKPIDLHNGFEIDEDTRESMGKPEEVQGMTSKDVDTFVGGRCKHGKHINEPCEGCDEARQAELEYDYETDEEGVAAMKEAPLTDPRERDKEKGLDVEKEPGADLSPEAQKIAGVDPESRAQRQQEKPKLEVDIDQKITILGKTGSGKTNLIKVLMSDILPDYHFVVLDAIGNLTEYEGQPNVDYHQTNPTNDAEVDQIIYSALEKGDCMVVIDEVDRYNSKKGTMLNELVNVGRNYGVGGVFAARRTASIDKDVLANSSYIFTFQHILPQDLDVLIDWFAQPEETFRDLQEFEAILFKDGDQIWVGLVPEKPTTKPTKKPTLPKKPKQPQQKGKGPEQKGQSPEGGSKPPTDEGAEKEPVEKKPPELTPADEGEVQAAEKSEARYAAEAPFMCEMDGQRFKYESDFEDHMVSQHAY